MCKTPVIHMFHTFYTGVYLTTTIETVIWLGDSCWIIEYKAVSNAFTTMTSLHISI